MSDTQSQPLDAAQVAEPVRAELITVPEAERATLLPSTNVLERLMFISNALARSGMPLPKNCRTAESIFAKLLVGWEHGLGPMTSLHEIHIVDGRASLPAAIKVGIIRQRGMGRIDVKTATEAECVVEVRRSDWKKGEWKEVRWTEEDTKRAGLHTKDNHRKYPRSMKIARACEEAVHTYFQEVFMGLPYSPDELGLETDEAGRPITVEFERPAAPSGPAGPSVAGAPPVSTASATPSVASGSAPSESPATPVASATTPRMAPPSEDSSEEDQIATEARRVADSLAICPEHRAAIFERHGENLPAYLGYLRSIDWLRRTSKHLGITDLQWGQALDKRGVDHDYELPVEVVNEMGQRFYEELTPFDRDTFGLIPTMAGRPDPQKPPTTAAG